MTKTTNIKELFSFRIDSGRMSGAQAVIPFLSELAKWIKAYAATLQYPNKPFRHVFLKASLQAMSK